MSKKKSFTAPAHIPKIFSFGKSQGGQAALTDSLFFLAIVSTICTSLFFFAINYGLQLEQEINSFYASDFANDSLKVVTYINVLRTGYSVYDAKHDGTDEYDYLLAVIKEDYANQAGKTRRLTEVTRRAIASTLDSVLRPFQDSIDYSFYIMPSTNNKTEKFLFLLLAVHECTSGDACNPVPVLDPVTGNYVVPSDEELEIERVYYYCEPRDNAILAEEVFPYVGQVDSAVGKITLFDTESTIDSQGRPFLMGLDVWVSKDIATLAELKDNTKTPDFNCTPIDVSAGFEEW